MSTFDVTELVTRGYVFIDVRRDLVEGAHRQYLRLIEAYKDQASEKVAFIRPGEVEPDLGLIFKNGQDADYKYYLHYAHDWWRHTRPPLSPVTPQALRKLYRFNNQVSVMITKALVKSYPTLFPETVVRSTITAALESVPYGTNALRGLYYPAATESQEQTGAKGHYDRGFLTIHLGDAGGQLIAHANEADTVGTAISPPPGKAVVFFGVKAALLTRNCIKPLWHSSRTVPGQDRTAMVHFTHIDVGQPVTHAGAVYRAFTERLSS